MPIYRTQYELPDGDHLRTTLYARDDKHLGEVMDLRKMGEMCVDGPAFGRTAIDPPMMASQLLASKRLAAANHALTWAAMIGARAGVADAWALMNDHGLLHQMAHLLHSREDSQDLGYLENQLMRLIPQVDEFERSVPGVHPCWGGGAHELPAAGVYAMALEEERAAHRAQMYQLMKQAIMQERLPVLPMNMGVPFCYRFAVDIV